MPKISKFSCFALPLLSLVPIIIFIAPLSFHSFFWQNDNRWSLEAISQFLDVQLPTDITNLLNNSERGRNTFISLEFDGPPESVSNFIEHLCGGVLHMGYDPFDAVDTIDPPLSAYLIKMKNFTYYSYSPNTSEKTLGNRCWDYRLGIAQVRIDASSKEIYHLRLETSNDPSICSKVPCHYLGINYIKPIKVIYPFTVIGIHEIGGRYVQMSDEICLEMQTDYDLYETVWTNSIAWSRLVGADVDVQIDNNQVIDSYIHDFGILLPQGTETANVYYNSCFNERLDDGKHTMTVDIKTGLDLEFVYSWNFYVDSNRNASS